ncbi:MAG: hypothetical protein ABL907_08105 [Hyphomicrobium sp.]
MMYMIEALVKAIDELMYGTRQHHQARDDEPSDLPVSNGTTGHA